MSKPAADIASPESGGTLASSEPAAIAPASYAQEGLWYLCRRLHEPEAYNITGAFSIRGPLDAGILQRVLTQMVARHDPLRTSFFEAEQGVLQRIAAPEEFDLAVVDLSSIAAPQRGALVEEHIHREATKPFDLAVDRMLRAVLLRLSTSQHVLLLSVHHIACDGRSVETLIDEAFRLYEAFSRGESSPLDELPMRYADYARWQRQMFDLGAWSEDQEYWRHLAGGITRLRLPADKPRCDDDSLRGAACQRVSNDGLAAALGQFCRREGVTPFVVLLAVYQCLLARYGAADEVFVSTPIHGRVRPELDALIGMFVNTVVISSSVGQNPSFRGLLRQVHDRVLGAHQHQMGHLDRAIQADEWHRGPSQMVQPQVAFAYAEDRFDNVQRGPLAMRRMTVPTTTSKFDLFLTATGAADELRFTMTFRESLFSSGRVEQLLEHFERLLRGALDTPKHRLWDLPMLSPEEQQQLVRLAWGPAAKRMASDEVHALLAAQVRRTPDSTAVQCQNETLTYRQWDLRADRLAGQLSALGVGRESHVAVCLDRSCDLVVALLATIKSAAVFVPLDPEYPQLRLDDMLRDSEATVLLTRSDLASQFEHFCGETVLLDRLPDARPTHPCGSPKTAPSDLAYLMFTSGSTAKPKAVEIERRSLSNYLRAMGDRLRLRPTDRVCQFASISFDAALKEILLALCAGAAIVFRPGKPFATVEQFHEFLERKRITVVNLPASFWHEWVDQLQRRPRPLPEQLRIVISGGEPADLRRLRAWRRLAPDVRWLNTYGPTEATINATAFELADDAQLDHADSVPIGRPLDNVASYVLDPCLQPVPEGATGELCLAGEGVARGYANRPRETAQQFAQDPFAGDPQQRLYRSGDLARWLPDANLELLGRKDFQIKLRGFRIEPGEVEAALRGHPSIEDSLVTAEMRDGVPHDLVAYIVVKDGHSPADSALRSFLRNHLPVQMIPGSFIWTKRLPRTVNGKLRRDALPAPAESLPRGSVTSDPAPPRNEVERRLCEIWSALLEQDSVGIRDDFFDLGGNSLLALRMFTRAEDEFNVRLPLVSIVHNGTIAKLAALIEDADRSSRRSFLVELQPHGTRPPLFCVHGIGGEVVQFAALAKHLDREQPFLGFQAPGRCDDQEPISSIEDLAQRYLRELRGYQAHGPYYLAGYSFGGNVALEMAQRLLTQGETVAALIMIDTAARSYARRRFKWIYVVRFIGSLPRWFFGDYLPSGWQGLWTRPARLVRLALKRLLRRLRPAGVREPFVDVEAVFYAPHVPAQYRRLYEAHYRALLDYRARPYPGKVILVRSEVAGLFGSLERDLGWSNMARDGAQVEVIPGAHVSMLSEPNVAILAETLARVVDEATRSDG